jgi:hypothetical protein
MGDYDLSRLETRSFEQLIQALAVKLLGPKTLVFGDGPDGGREATYEGRMALPAEGETWNGYLVLQAKFRQRPEGPSKDGPWALQMLEQELEAFADSTKRRRKPDYYIFATNVVMSPTHLTGAKDKAAELVKKYAARVPLKGFMLWDFDQLRAYLDGFEDIRHAYTAFITPGDVLAKVMERLSQGRPDFSRVMTNFLEKELLADRYANLEKAGHHTRAPIELAPVFVDVPFHEGMQQEERVASSATEARPRVVAHLLSVGALRLSQDSSAPSEFTSLLDHFQPGAAEPGRYVLIGGPGQGKTTISQFLSQIYRCAILKDRQRMLTPTGRRVFEEITKHLEPEGLSLPGARRFPIRIILNEFAAELERQNDLTLPRYIAERIAWRTHAQVVAQDVQQWLESYPWVLILDGLDEVPASSNRERLIGVVRDFTVDVAQSQADVLIVATTRPQGYTQEFSPSVYRHLTLSPLSGKEALRYAGRLVSARYGQDTDRGKQVLTKLSRACDNEATARLMRSPLQVTIMTALVEAVGNPPQDRWQLFNSYYGVIYSREMDRDIPAADILRRYRADIDAIHQRVGLRLQVANERAGETDTRLSSQGFSELVEARLQEEGHEGAEREELKNRIIQAASERLVFLVGLEADRIGFEIRSFQEFMAAECLLNGSDDSVRLRLAEITAIPYWRNVLLFMAGKCFGERQHLRNDFVVACEKLNDDPQNGLLRATLAGSQLAVDLLEEGTALRQPQFARILLRQAFKLLPLGPPASHDLFADLYEPNLREVFEQEITARLQNQNFELQLGAWLVLLHLEERGVEWASQKLSRDWPASASQQLKLFLHQDIPYDPNTIDRLERLVSTSSLEVANKVVHYLSWLGVAAGTGALFVWMARFHELELGERRFYVSFQGEPQAVSLFLQELAPARFAPGILEMEPSRLPRWTLLRAAARFADFPGPESLAAALRALSEDWDEPSIRIWEKRVPWPLGVCLAHCTSPADALALAGRAERGELGTGEHWFHAERRWESLGVELDDLAASGQGGFSLSPEIASRGFPLEVVRPYRRGLPAPLLEKLTRLALTLPGAGGKILASLVLQQPPPPFKDSLDLAPGEFQRLMDRVQEVPVTVINALRWSPEAESEAVEAVRASSSKLVKAHGFLERLHPQKQVALRRAFEAAPQQVELLVPLALDMLKGWTEWEPLITKVDAKSVDQISKPRAHVAALFLWLRQGLADEEVDAFADQVAGLADTLAEFIGNLEDMLRYIRVVKDEDERLFLALYQRVHHTPAAPVLLHFLSSRLAHLKSHLDEEQTWKRLELPPGLLPAS